MTLTRLSTLIAIIGLAVCLGRLLVGCGSVTSAPAKDGAAGNGLGGAGLSADGAVAGGASGGASAGSGGASGAAGAGGVGGELPEPPRDAGGPAACPGELATFQTCPGSRCAIHCTDPDGGALVDCEAAGYFCASGFACPSGPC
jgi:hypothetical protein